MILILNLHNAHLPAMSPSNPHILTQNLLTAMYLFGICNQPELHFPDVWNACKSPMVSQALKGVKHCFGQATTHKLPLTINNLNTVYYTLGTDPPHDDVLFATQLFTGFKNLLCLGELCWPDKVALWDYCKVTMWHTVEVFDDYIGLFLPAHKGDALFEGNHLIICPSSEKAFELVIWYLTSWDQNFWACPELWLHIDGTSPLVPGLWLSYVLSSINPLGANQCMLMGPQLLQRQGFPQLSSRLQKGGPQTLSTVTYEKMFSSLRPCLLVVHLHYKQAFSMSMFFRTPLKLIHSHWLCLYPELQYKTQLLPSPPLPSYYGP